MIKLKDNIEKPTENNEKEIYRNIFEYAKMTLDLEEKREQSLISQSSRMLTAFSITTGVFFVIYKIVKEAGTVSDTYLNSVSVICMLLFVASMILALLVSWRYKYQALKSPLSTMNHVIANKTYFETSEQRDKSFTETINSIWESKNRINDKRAHLISASMVVYFISIGIAVASVLIILIKNIV